MADATTAARPGSESPKEDAATRATREELRHTVISEKTGQGEDAADSDSAANADARAATPDVKPDVKDMVSSPKKKRAHDQVDGGSDDTRHQRSKSKVGELAAAGAEGADANGRVVSPVAEPDKKRLRDLEAKTASGDNDKPTTSATAFASSGFAKLSSSASPFGSLAGSGAAGKPSVFGAASSSASPFGALLSASTPKPSTPLPAPSLSSAPTLSFGSSSATSPFAGLPGASTGKLFGSSFGGNGAATSGGFGSAASGSGFGSATATAGTSVFGGALSGARLTSFAQPGAVFKSDKPAKPFGAPESDAEESGDDESGSGGDDEANTEEVEGNDDGADAKTAGEEKKKLRLQRVVVNDGEAGEATVLQVRARMYHLDKDQGGWKERGVGMLKVNVPEHCVEFDREGNAIPASFDASALDHDGDDDSDSENDAGEDAQKSDPESAAAESSSRAAAVPKRSVVRLIMRQDSTHRVILNTVVLAATEFQERQTLKSTTVLFTAFEGAEAKPVAVQMKMNVANATTFLRTMEGIKRELRGD